MKATELFQQMSENLAQEILFRLVQSQPEAMNASIHTLAVSQKLRPAFVSRKKPGEMITWLTRSLGRAQNEVIAFNLLREWLIDAQMPLRVDFLDAVKISHDGKGMVDDIPNAPAKEICMDALELLAKKYPGEVIRIYLECFLMITSPEQGWSQLLEACAVDPRFALGKSA